MRSIRKSLPAFVSKKLLLHMVLLVAVLPLSLHAQGNWPMPGHDQQKTSRANFAGPSVAPAAPDWTFPTSAPIVGDIAVSAEGKLYFASDKLYGLNPDGTSFASAVTNGSPATSPVVDDTRGLVFIAVSNPGGGFDILSFSKLLQNPAVLLHVPSNFGGGISPLVLSNFGILYFTAGRFPGTVYAIGPRTLPDGSIDPFALLWSNAICQGESGASSQPNAPAVTGDGALVFVMCSAAGVTPGGLFRLNAGDGTPNLQLTGPSSVATNPGSTEPAIGPGGIYAGWQSFGGAIFCGDFLSWDVTLNPLTTPSNFCDSSRFTTSRAAISPDGHSTVRIGFAFPPNNQLDAAGVNNWIVSTDNSTIPNFSSLPSIDAAGDVFIGNTQGIQARSGVDGHILWSLDLGDKITTQPVIANGGALYVGSSSGIVYAFNTQPKLPAGAVYVNSGAIVDLATASIAGRFPGTDSSLKVSPDGTRIYESATFGLDVVDASTNKVITTIPVGSRPISTAFSPDGSRIYVSQPNIGSEPGVLEGLYVVDAATNTIIASITIPGVERVAVAPDNSRVYVSSQGRGIVVVDPATDTVTGSISILGANLTGIAFTPDSARAYVGEFFGPFLYQIDARTNSLINTVPLTGALGGGVGDVIASPDGRKIYAGNDRTGPFDPAHNVFVLETATNTVTAQIPVSFPGEQMALSTDGATILIGDSDTGALIAASTATDAIVEALAVTDPCCHTISGIGAKPPAATALTPQLRAPTAVDFGTVVIGSPAKSNISLVNAGRVPVTITAAAVSDPNFAIVPPLVTPITIAPGASTELTVTFTPAAKGAFSGNLTIAVLGLPSSATVNLTGTAILPAFLNVVPPALDFGTVSIAETKQLQLQIQNTGDAPLVGSVSLSLSDAFTISGPADFSVLGGQIAQVTVSFAPRVRTQFTGTLTVASNAGSATISLAGQGERVAVVLVHGFDGDPTSFGQMESLLQSTANLEVFPFDYSADTGLFKGLLIERIAGNLAAFLSDLRAHGVDRVDVVAHSMGGLVARAYITDMAIQNGTFIPYAGDIRKLITIGTPNYGVPPRLLTNIGAKVPGNKQAQEMLFSSDFVLELDKNWREQVANGFTPRINQADILTIIGTQTPDGSVPPFVIDDDGLVPGPSATLPCAFLSCDVNAPDQNVRYVPYQHADIEILGVDVLGDNPAEAFVPENAIDFETFRLVRDFLLEKPLELIFPPPSQFTDNGLLMIHLIDADTQKPIRLFDSITSASVDGSSVEINANDKRGVITIWPISTGQHQIQIFLNSFVYPDPDSISIDLRGERPTEITVPLHRRRFL